MVHGQSGRSVYDGVTVRNAVIKYFSEFRAVTCIIHCPELVPGSKTTVSAQNFTFSLHVDVW